MLARLSKGGRRILCGRENCREQLGSRVPTRRWVDANGQRTQSDEYIAVLAKGYRRFSDGVFRMTQRAKERRDLGRLPTFRRGTGIPTICGTYSTPCYNPHHLTRGAPVMIECARCRAVSRLTDDSIHTA